MRYLSIIYCVFVKYVVMRYPIVLECKSKNIYKNVTKCENCKLFIMSML